MKFSAPTEYVEHYNRHRPHQSLDQQPAHPPTPVTWPHTGSTILCRAVLGGLINGYARAALPSENPAQGTNPGFEAAQAQPLLLPGGIGLVLGANGRVSVSSTGISHRHHTQGSHAICS
jgi:hypothetical protein